MNIQQSREFCFPLSDSRMDIRIKLQMAEGPLSPAGEGGFPSRPFYHQGLIRVEMKTSLLEVFFSCVTVFVLFLIKRHVLLLFHAAFGVLPVIHSVKGEYLCWCERVFPFIISFQYWTLYASN